MMHQKDDASLQTHSNEEQVLTLEELEQAHKAYNKKIEELEAVIQKLIEDETIQSVSNAQEIHSKKQEKLVLLYERQVCINRIQRQKPAE